MQHDFGVWVGIDWATEEHQVCGVDGQSQKLFAWKVKHTGDDIGAFVERLLAQAGGAAERIAVAIETPRGSIATAFVERGIAAFSLNPKQLDRFRDRHTMGGAKSDRLDAFVLADSPRTDLRLYRRIELGDPVLVELREMVRARETLVADGVALGSRLREQLHRDSPQVLKLGSVDDDAWLGALLELAPTPAQAARLTRPKVAHLLRQHRVRRRTAEEVLAVLGETPLVVAPGVVEAASAHVRLLLPLLRLNRAQVVDCEGRIEELRKRVGRSPDAAPAPPVAADDESAGPARPHRDADILLSVPGLGVLTSATMLAEASTALRHRDYQRLRAQTGVAPISAQTGKQRKPTISMRHACNLRLRNAVYHWARVSTQRDPVARAHYTRLRQVGHSHGRPSAGAAARDRRQLAPVGSERRGAVGRAPGVRRRSHLRQREEYLHAPPPEHRRGDGLARRALRRPGARRRHSARGPLVRRLAWTRPSFTRSCDVQ